MRLRGMTGFVAVVVAVVFAGVSAATAGEPTLLPVKNLIVDQIEPVLEQRASPDDEFTRTRHLGIAIRGVFPIERQLRSLADEGVDDVNINAFEVIDFQLQRQATEVDAPFGEDTSWKPVDMQVFRKMVVNSSGLDAEPAPQASIDAAITAPLPFRIDKAWDDVVLHPKLDENGDNLLLRYLDFDVEPQTYYRYRVKLELRNPNHRKRTSDPFLAIGETRLTPWSKPSPAILVETDESDSAP